MSKSNKTLKVVNLTVSLHQKYRRLILSVILLLLTLIGSVLLIISFNSTDNRTEAGAANFCESLQYKRCTDNASICEWKYKQKDNTSKRETCSNSDCKKGIAGCSWSKNKKNKQICNGTYIVVKKQTIADGKCSLRDDLKVKFSNMCKDGNRWVEDRTILSNGKICKKGSAYKIECNRYDQSYCLAINGGMQFIKCDEYGQKIKDEKCLTKNDKVCTVLGCADSSESLR